MESGDYDLALVAVNLSEVPDVSPMFIDDGDVNFNNFHTDRLDELLVDTMSATEDAYMKNAYSALQTYIVENLPVMGLCFRTGMVLSNRSLAGFTATRETDAYSGMEFLLK